MAPHTSTPDLGIDAYANQDVSTADLLINLEGQPVHRFTEGTGEHAGTALMVVELPDGNGLGLQISMEENTSMVPTLPNARERDDGWAVDDFTRRYEIDRLTEMGPDLEIVEVVHHNLMDPDNARVVLIVDPPTTDNPFGLDFYLHEDGGTDFFEVDL